MKKIMTMAIIVVLFWVPAGGFSQVPTVEKILADFQAEFPIYIKAHPKSQTVKEFSVLEKDLTIEGTTFSRVKLNAANYMEFVVDIPPEMVPFIEAKSNHLVYMKDTMFVGGRGVCVFGFHARAYSDQPKKMVADIHRFQWFPLASGQEIKNLKFPTKKEVSLPKGFHTIGEPKATGYGEATYGKSWKIAIQAINGINEIIDVSEEELWFIKKYQNALLYVSEQSRVADFEKFKTAQQEIAPEKRKNSVLINLESYLRGRGMLRYYFIWLYPQ